MARTHRIAVLPGDGIGKETVPESLKVLGAAGQRRAHAGHQLARPQIHILVEAAADRDQQAPQ